MASCRASGVQLEGVTCHISVELPHTAGMMKGIIDKVEDVEVDRMYAAWLRDSAPAHEAAEPTRWKQATEDLAAIPAARTK